MGEQNNPWSSARHNERRHGAKEDKNRNKTG